MFTVVILFIVAFATIRASPVVYLYDSGLRTSASVAYVQLTSNASALCAASLPPQIATRGSACAWTKPFAQPALDVDSIVNTYRLSAGTSGATLSVSTLGSVVSAVDGYWIDVRACQSASTSNSPSPSSIACATQPLASYRATNATSATDVRFGSCTFPSSLAVLCACQAVPTVAPTKSPTPQPTFTPTYLSYTQRTNCTKIQGLGNAFVTSIALSNSGSMLVVGSWAMNSGAGGAAVFSYDGASGLTQQTKTALTGTGSVGQSFQGWSLAVSGDGSTIAIGGPIDNNTVGATWIFVRDGSGNWSQQGSKLIGTGYVDLPMQANSVALSGDGNTLAIGGPYDDNTNFYGAVWMYTRSGTTWTQQGSKLNASDHSAYTYLGWAVSLSADGNTLAASSTGPNQGGVYIYVRSSNVWSRQGPKLVGNGSQVSGDTDIEVSLSSNGNTLAVGVPGDSSDVGAVWMFTRSGTTWTQLGGKLVGTGYSGISDFGYRVALAGDASRLIVGQTRDPRGKGSFWVFEPPTTGNTSWAQIGNPYTPSDDYGQPAQEQDAGRWVAIAPNNPSVVALGSFSKCVWMYTSN